MDVLVKRGISKSRACALLDLHRSTFYYHAREDQNAQLEQELRELAQKHPRYGYRRITQRVLGAAAPETHHQS